MEGEGKCGPRKVIELKRELVIERKWRAGIDGKREMGIEESSEVVGGKEERREAERG